MKNFIKTLIISMLLAVIAITQPIHASEMQNFYPQTLLVYALDEEEDIVYLTSFTGLQYAVAVIDDYEVGDIVAAIMYDGATPNDITDDLVHDMRYTGSLKNL